MRRIVLALTAVLLVGAVSAGCGGEDGLPENAAAQVGQTIIEKDDFETRVSELAEQLGDQAPDEDGSPDEYQNFRSQVLDYMVTLEILEQKQDELGVEVTEEDLSEQVDQIKGMFGGDETKFEEALSEQGFTLEEFEENLREQELIRQSVEAVTADLELTDEEISAYYEEHQEEFEVGESREARHILISPEGEGEDGSSGSGEYSDEAWEEARRIALEVREEILDGADFGEKAKEYSDDPGSADQGGDLGNVYRGSMVAPFEEALFGLGEGDISQPVKTQYGYHLIQLREVNPPGTQELGEVRDQIEAQLLEERKGEDWEAWLNSAKEELDVEYMEGLEPATSATAVDEQAEGADTTATTAE